MSNCQYTLDNEIQTQYSTRLYNNLVLYIIEQIHHTTPMLSIFRSQPCRPGGGSTVVLAGFTRYFVALLYSSSYSYSSIISQLFQDHLSSTFQMLHSLNSITTPPTIPFCITFPLLSQSKTLIKILRYVTITLELKLTM